MATILFIAHSGHNQPLAASGWAKLHGPAEKVHCRPGEIIPGNNPKACAIGKSQAICRAVHNGPLFPVSQEKVAELPIHSQSESPLPERSHKPAPLRISPRRMALGGS
jgi:hypothetical protein